MNAVIRPNRTRGQWYWIATGAAVAKEVSAADVRANLREAGYTTREIQVAMHICRKARKLACTVNGGAYQYDVVRS